MTHPIWNLPTKVANDVASVTVAGHLFSWAGMTAGPGGGIVSLRVGLRGSSLVALARALARLEGVRVTSGPPIAARGDCFLVHCPGFKLVLSMPDPNGDFGHALLSRANAPVLAVTCELSAALAGLMAPRPRPRQTPSPELAGPERAGPRTSTLRRSPLQPGKTLVRKASLARKTPLGRGRPKPS